MEKNYIGYQFMEDGRYSGPYRFVSTEENPHVPPHTTLVQPPAYNAGSIPVWSNGSWSVEEDPYYNKHNAPEINDGA